MRTRFFPVVTVLLAAFAALAVLAARRVRADEPAPPVDGSFAVEFKEIANNCSDTGMSLRKGTVTLAKQDKGKDEITVPMAATMVGRIGKDGKFMAHAKLGGTGIAGLQGKFSISGRVEDARIQLVFSAEYYRDQRPLCTKSWNGAGTRTGK
jgi:hypothetical protein